MKTSGVFITFEGPEGAGKSTHTRLLCEYLRAEGRDVAYIREPGSTIVGEKVRRILLDPKNKGICSVAEVCLYMAARAQLVEELIAPALKKRSIVISDRFLDATLAYQGYGSGVDIAWIRRIGRVVSAGLRPDLTIVLDADTKKGLNQAGKVNDRIERRPLSYHKRVRRGYLELAKREPGRIKIVRQDKDINKTQEVIRELVDKFVARIA